MKYITEDNRDFVNRREALAHEIVYWIITKGDAEKSEEMERKIFEILGQG